MAATSATPFCVHACAAAALACLLAVLPVPVVLLAAAVWVFATCHFVEAHGHRVMIRTAWSNDVRLANGSMLLMFPQYVVSDKNQFGPWRSRGQLPLVGQVLEVDVPEVLVMVEQGLYCLKVNTKVVGCVQDCTVESLIQNPISIEHRIHDVIASTLRSAVHDKSLEEALVDIQRLFSKDIAGISALIAVPAFQVTQLLLDPNASISAADAATRQALDIIVQRKQEKARGSVLEASMETEEQKVRLRRIALQISKEELMLQQETYGQEGAALIEAAKHAKTLYLFAGPGAGGAMTHPAGWLQAER